MTTTTELDRVYIGHNIRSLRELEGLSLTGLSERLRPHGVQMTKATLSKIEGGSRQVTAEELPALALALNATPNRLLIGESAEGPGPLSVSPAIDPRALKRVWSWAQGEFPLEDMTFEGESGGEKGFTEAAIEFREHQRRFVQRNQPHQPISKDPDAVRAAMEADPTGANGLSLIREGLGLLASTDFSPGDIQYLVREEARRPESRKYGQSVRRALEEGDAEALSALGIEIGTGPREEENED